MHAAPLSFPRHHVPRPRLVAALRDARLATVVAGGGYGKTTLALELGRALDSPVPIARLAPGHGDPASLVSALAAAFRSRGLSDLAEALEGDAAEPDAAVGRVLAALDADRDITLVVDEIDHLDPEAGVLVERLARELPGSARLLLVGRTLPPSLIGLASAATSLGQAELAFTVDETAVVLMRAGLPELGALASRLRRLVDGWPLAVALAARRLAHAADSELELAGMEATPIVVSGLLDASLGLLDTGDVHSVRQLALLPQLTVEVAERAIGVGVVARATAAGVPFDVSVDGLVDMPDPVREALAARAVLSTEVATRAAEAYLERGTGADAVRVLVAAGESDLAAASAAALGPQELSRLDVRELRALVASIPPDAVDRHPRALLHLARACEASAERDLRTELLERVASLARDDDVLEREVEAEVARDLVRDGRVDEARKLAEELLADAGADELQTRVRALHVLGRTHAWGGEPEGLAAAEPLLEEAAELYGRLGFQTARAHALLALAYDVHTLGGRFDAAVGDLERALACLPTRSRLRGVVLVFLAEALIDLGRLLEAEAILAEAERLGALFGDRRTLGYTGWLRARVAASLGDAARVRAQLVEAESQHGEWFVHHTGAEFLAEASLLLGQVGEERLAEEYLRRALGRASESPKHVLLAEGAFEARYGDPARAETVLAEVAGRPDLDARESWRPALLRAWSAHRAGELDRTRSLAETAFSLARRTGAPDLPLRREPEIAVAMLALLDGSAADPEAPSPPEATITVLGGFAARRAGAALEIPAGRPSALVKLLALHGGRRPVDAVVESLWPGVELSSGRKRLRNVLNRLRASADALVVREGDILALAEGTVVDAILFERRAQEAIAQSDQVAGRDRARAALAMYAGEALPDERYEDWAAEPRERLRGRVLGLLDLLASDAERDGDLDEALRLLARAIELDRIDEQRYVRSARLLLRQGRRGRALELLRASAAALRELGLEPSAEHRALVRATRD